MLITTKAIVLSKLKFKDYDLIVNCYTQEKGIVSFIVKGVLKSKKGKFKTAYFQPLNILETVVDLKDNRGLQYFKEVKVGYNFKSVYTNIFKSTITMFLSEVLSNALKEEEQNEALYSFLETSLVFFDTSEPNSNFHLMFLLELSKYLGFYPDVAANHLPYFDLESGSFQQTKTSNNYISGENLTIFKQLLGTKFDDSVLLKINTSQKRELLNMIISYFKLHLDGFKHPKSVAVLNQVFN